MSFNQRLAQRGIGLRRKIVVFERLNCHAAALPIRC
jgi:hypothetical protein